MADSSSIARNVFLAWFRKELKRNIIKIGADLSSKVDARAGGSSFNVPLYNLNDPGKASSAIRDMVNQKLGVGPKEFPVMGGGKRYEYHLSGGNAVFMTLMSDGGFGPTDVLFKFVSSTGEITDHLFETIVSDLESSLSSNARYKRYELNISSKVLYWVTQDTSERESKIVAADIAKWFSGHGFKGWTIKVCVRDDYVGNGSSPWQTAKS